MKFEMNDGLRNLLNGYSANIETFDRAFVAHTTNPNVPLEAILHTHEREENIRDAPGIVADTAKAYMSHFPELFEDTGLSKETWSDYLRQYYYTLTPKSKEEVILDILGRRDVLTKKEREKLAKNDYIILLQKMAHLGSLLEKEKLDENDLIQLLGLHYTYKGKKGEPIPNQYVASALRTYPNNPNVIKGMIEMKSRLYEIQKGKISNKEKKKADKIMDFSDENAVRDYSIGNYTKAARIYAAHLQDQERVRQRLRQRQQP